MTCTGVSRAGEVATGIGEVVTGNGAGGGSGADTGSGTVTGVVAFFYGNGLLLDISFASSPWHLPNKKCQRMA